MSRLVLGVIGHVDHGKTALVRALTGEDTDRLKEEKERGISIALGFAHFKAGPHTDIDLIDMPGHERFVRTMISGATGMDAVLLVLAASEGVKPQTIEHVDIAGLLGIRRAVLAISKTDLVAPEQAKQVAEDGIRLLTRSGLDPLPPVMISVPRETGIDDLRQALTALAANEAPRAGDGVPFLPIDRAFSIAGHGPVVTGTLRGAAVAARDELELWPLRRIVRVRAVQIHGARVAAANPGHRVALNLRGVDIAELKRGMVLAARGTLELSEWLTLSIRAVDGAPPLKNGMTLHAMLGTDERSVRLRLLDRETLEAGQTGFAQLHCNAPVALPAREHVVLRLASPARTVAGGRILEPAARRQRRHCPPILARLESLHSLPPAAMIEGEVRREGPAGTSVQRLSQLSALAAPRVVEFLRACPVVATRAGLIVHKAAMEDLLSRIPPLLAPHSRGLSTDQMLSALPGTGEAVLEEALARLLARGAIDRRASQFLVRWPHEEQARLESEEALAGRIAELLRRGGLTPPDPRTLVRDALTKRAVEHMVRKGILVRAVDRAKGREILFHRDAIEDARRRLAPLLRDGPGLLVSEVGEALGMSRKYSVPLLDHFDSVRFTRRIEDRRVLGTVASSAR